MYIAKKIEVEPTLQLDALARESGRCYSEIIKREDTRWQP